MNLLEVGTCIMIMLLKGHLEPTSLHNVGPVHSGMSLSVYAVKTVDAVTPVTVDEAPPQTKPQGMRTADALVCLALQKCIPSP